MARCAAEISGPISVASGVGSPTTTPATAGSSRAMKRVVDRPLHQNAGTGAAVLAGVVEDAVGGPGGGQLHVGVGEDDVGALAPELERDPLHLVGTAGHDGPPDLGRAGEADLAHGRVGHEALPDHAALAGQDLEDPFGESGLQGQLSDAQRAERGQLGRLEDHGVAGGQRGANPQPAMAMGKFHGTMIPTTPSGSWKVRSTPPGTGIWRPLCRSGAAA